MPAERKPDATAIMQRQAQDYALFSDRLSDCEGDPEAERRWLAELQTAARSLTENAERFVLGAQRLDHEADYYSTMAAKFHEAARLRAKWAEAIRDAVLRAMLDCGMTKYEGDAIKLGVQNSPPAVDIDPDATVADFDVRYVRVKEELDKKTIKTDLEAGVEIPKARLVQRRHLRVRI